IRIAEFRRDDARAFFDAINESFAHEWGFKQMAYDDWFQLRVENSDSSLYFIAWDGDEIAGFVRGDRREETGWIGMIGVRNAWRRRGIAEALLRHSFLEFDRRGMTLAALGVDSENPTGATRVYERVGLNVEAEDVSYERSLAWAGCVRSARRAERSPPSRSAPTTSATRAGASSARAWSASHV